MHKNISSSLLAMRNISNIVVLAIIFVAAHTDRCNAQVPKYRDLESWNNRSDLSISGLPTDFDWNIGRMVYKSEQTNAILSTISVKLSLAMLYLGAVGSTAKEIENVLWIQPGNRDEMLSKFNSVSQSLQASQNEYELDIGTKLFLDKSVTPNPEVVHVLKHYFNSAIEIVNFKQKLASVKIINNWAAKITGGKLQQLLTTDDTRDNTLMLLVSAMYFKGLWEKPFPESATKAGPFTLLSGDKVETPYMTVVDQFRYIELQELDCKAIRLPYAGKKFAMYIYLPNKKTGLDRLAEKITPQILKSTLAQMKEQIVQLTLPRFRFESTLILGPLLQKLGLRQTFSPNAELNNIGYSPFGRITVSNVLQKGGLEVNEQGSTAFSATEVILDTKVTDSVDAHFKADHPFIFSIIKEDTNIPAFVGKLVNPVSVGQRVVDVSSAHVRMTRDVQYAEEVIKYKQESLDIGTYHEDRYNSVDIKLLTALDRPDNKSTIISPESIKSALAMLWEGSKGETAEELGYVLKLSEDNVANEKLLRKHQLALMDKNTNVTLLYGSRVYLALGIQLLPAYERKLKKDYFADVKLVNFTDQATVANINKWVQDSIQDIIPTLVEPDQFDSFSKVFLVNFIYFKVEWLEEFDVDATVPDCFYPMPGVCMKTSMMNIKTKMNYKYLEEMAANIVELPFKDTRFSMIIVLPDEKSALSALLSNMAHSYITDLTNNMTSNIVALSLPRFAIEYSTSLKKTLQVLGVSKTFTNADLSGMVDTKDQLYVSDVLHKARIEIDEKGAKSAASTGLEVQNRMIAEGISVKVNHPFVFFIRDKSTEGILFEGTVTSILKQVTPPSPSPPPTTKSPSSAISLCNCFNKFLFLLLPLLIKFW